MGSGLKRRVFIPDALQVTVGGSRVARIEPHDRGQTDEDLKAMFGYLKTLAPAKHAVDSSLAPTGCPRCGGEHGAGERNASP